jgi:peptidoglycan hydrolase CwlO-like protein
MSDNDHGSRPTPKNKRTVEIYQDLVHVEVRSLVNRVTELTQTIGDVFGEVTALALQLEESSGKVEQLGTSLEYCKDEIKKLKDKVAEHTQLLKDPQNGED